MLGKDCFSHASILFLYLSIFLSSDGNHYQSPTKLRHTLTYYVNVFGNDLDTLDALEDQLKVYLELLENEAPKEEGIIVQPVKVKRKVKESNIKDEIP